MAITDERILRLKIAALLHDPPEKAGILFAAPHEDVAKELLTAAGLEPQIPEAVRQADRMAAGADRFPLEDRKKYAVGWRENPQLTHPLSGRTYDLAPHDCRKDTLISTDWETVSASVREAVGHIEKEYSNLWMRYLALWRLLPRYLMDGRFHSGGRKEELGLLWSLLPADSRIPDHSIWEHARLTSALVGAGDDPALFFFALGPVQSLIAAARKSADLWAGSVFLSELLARALLAVASELGPDAVIFPDVWGHPQVDRWLAKEGVKDCEPEDEAFRIPSLPNQFLAVVPLEKVEKLAAAAEGGVKEFLEGEAKKYAAELKEQGRAQLLSAIETYWSAVPWKRLFTDKEGKGKEELLSWWRKVQNWTRKESAFLKQIKEESAAFRFLNSGAAYGSLVDLARLSLDSVKASRVRAVEEEEGRHRCHLCGLRSAVWEDPRDEDRVDRLCGVCTVKRRLGRDRRVHGQGFPSTSTLAAAPWFERLAETLESRAAGTDRLRSALEKVRSAVSQVDKDKERYWIPDHTHEKLRSWQILEDLAYADARWLYLDAVSADGQEGSRDLVEALRELRGALQELHLPVEPRRYYAVLVADGDGMGKWLSGERCPSYDEVVHQKVMGHLPFGDVKRPYAPAYQAALSRALRDFARHVIPHVVEKAGPGALVYAGGDDVLALLPLEPLPRIARMIRYAFAGEREEGDREIGIPGARMRNGFARFERGRHELYRLLGPQATLSAGIAVAHAKSPMRLALEAARECEELAKSAPEKNAVGLAVLKRSGDREVLCFHWAALDVMDLVAGVFRGRPSQELPGARFFLSRKFVGHLEESLPLLEREPEARQEQILWLLRRHLYMAGGASEEAQGKILCQEKERIAQEVSAALEAVLKRFKEPRHPSGYPEEYFWPSAQLVRLVAAAEFLARERDE
ncbi:MAG TPA: type III-B CRISPR-associated protein Cas10/Cmr2 [Planctomycetota bacterium]|nr:type III-B CRISPR-associated protein Cas10/Cmr2 [Planctomycetota bacterium]